MEVFHESKNKNVQLWLDLRQTTISPQTALLHLTNDIWDEYTPPSDKSFLVDKVLVNHNHNIDCIANDIRDEFETEVGLLSFSEETNELFEMNSEGVMIPIGHVVNVKDENGNGVININVDPMPILETVSRGEWVLLDVNENVDSGSISSLVELVSSTSTAGVFGGLAASAGELSLSSSPSASSSPGGIGFSCQSEASVVEIGGLIKSFSGNKVYERTKSGILVQSLDEGEDNNERTNDFGGGGAPLEYAIVMPFDAMLWKTSSFVFGASAIEP